MARRIGGQYGEGSPKVARLSDPPILIYEAQPPACEVEVHEFVAVYDRVLGGTSPIEPRHSRRPNSLIEFLFQWAAHMVVLPSDRNGGQVLATFGSETSAEVDSFSSVISNDR
jgi:hypothetical protein